MTKFDHSSFTANSQNQKNSNFYLGKISSTTCVSVPSGAAMSAYDANSRFSNQLAQTINNITNAQTPSIDQNQMHVSISSSPELTFGAPQIDLSMPQGALAVNGLHEIHPIHYRDQSIALTFALALAARRKHSGETAPIFCFLPENETFHDETFSKRGLLALDLSQEDIIIVTAKHSDDLLWAMEETLHNTHASAIIGHVPLLDSLRAQRLNCTAQSAGIPCLIVCNHKSSEVKHSLTSWTIREMGEKNQSTNSLTGSLSLTHCKSQIPNKSWQVKWHPDQKRFAATNTPLKERTVTNNTIH